jgi:hypothetical protein
MLKIVAAGLKTRKTKRGLNERPTCLCDPRGIRAPDARPRLNLLTQDVREIRTEMGEMRAALKTGKRSD